MYRSTTAVLFVVTLAHNLDIIHSESQCKRSLPSYDQSGSNLTGGIQLLVPSWNFSCQGFISEWQAHMLGNTSITDSIEFQIFKPDSQQPGLYHSVYSNTYLTEYAEMADGTTITLPILNQANELTRIPVRVGSIVGIYIRPEAADLVSLLYNNVDGVDAYYWNNVSQPPCDRLVCDGSTQVMKIKPLIGWKFNNVVNSFSSLETALEAVKNVSPICNNVQLASCPTITHQTSSITPSNTLTTSITTSTLSTTIQTMTANDHTTRLSTTSQGPYPTSTLNFFTSVVTLVTASPEAPDDIQVDPSSEIETLQLALVGVVAGLLILAIILTVILIMLLLTKYNRFGCKSKRPSGINPSYCTHSILSSELGNGHYKYIMQDYCRPESCDTLKQNLEHDTWSTTIYDEPTCL